MGALAQFVAFGPRIYKVVRPFATWPSSVRIGVFSKGAVDSQGRLYVCQRTDPPILVFGRDGRFLHSLGDGREADCHGIWIDADDRVFVVDRDGHELLCYAPGGDLLFKIGERERPRFNAPFSHPTDVALGPGGDIYVADGYGNSVVHRFSPDGKLKRTFGRCGTGPGEFMTPHGINLLPDGRLLVGDRENNRLQVFDPEGNYLTEWRGFFHPMDIYVAPDGLVYVTDQRPRVSALNDRGEIIGACKPALEMPHGITGNRDGNIFIIETRNTQITKLEPVR